MTRVSQSVSLALFARGKEAGGGRRQRRVDKWRIKWGGGREKVFRISFPGIRAERRLRLAVHLSADAGQMHARVEAMHTRSNCNPFYGVSSHCRETSFMSSRHEGVARSKNLHGLRRRKRRPRGRALMDAQRGNGDAWSFIRRTYVFSIHCWKFA